MSEVIPNEAVEAAAEAMAALGDEDSGENQFADFARAALEAAAPHMLAEALRLADKWQEDFPYKARELRAALVEAAK